MIKRAAVVVFSVFLAGCASTHNSKTIGGVDIPETVAGICETFYTVAQVTVEEEPSVTIVRAHYSGKFREFWGSLEIIVYGKDGYPLRVNRYEYRKLPPTVPLFVQEHMSYRGSWITVTCGGRQGEREFDVRWKGKAKLKK